MEKQALKTRPFVWLFINSRIAIVPIVGMVVGFFSNFFGFFSIDISLIPFSIKVLLVIAVAVSVHFFRTSQKLLNNYNSLILQYNEASSVNNTLGALIGYKRELFCQIHTIDDSGIVSVKSRYVIKAFQDLREITLFWATYYGLKKEDVEKEKKDFIAFNNYKGGNIGTNIVYDGIGKIFYKVKFIQNLKIDDDPVTIETKTTYPADSGHKPESIYKKIIRENGRMIYYAAYVPTDKLKMEIKLPTGKEYEPLDCLNGHYCFVAPHGSEDFMFEKMKDIECKDGSCDGTGKRNSFKFSVDYPAQGLVYGFCWKEAKKSKA